MAAGRTGLFVLFFLPRDWFPHLSALNGLNITGTSVTEKLNLAAAAKPYRQPVCLVKEEEDNEENEAWIKKQTRKLKQKNKQKKQQGLKAETLDCYLPIRTSPPSPCYIFPCHYENKSWLINCPDGFASFPCDTQSAKPCLTLTALPVLFSQRQMLQRQNKSSNVFFPPSIS